MGTTLSAYYNLTKPGIIRGNALTASAGFLLAAQGDPDLGVFIAMIFGISAIIASACVTNNYIDRKIDSKMARTRKRALVSGEISGRNALIFAALLGTTGLLVLALFANVLTALLGLFAYLMYVVAYGYVKRSSVHGTLVGTVSGAMPPVGGYAAVSGRLDLACLILFLILVLWQMPHFFAIAIFRRHEYKAAGIPVFPLIRGIPATKRRMVAYMAAFTVAAISLTIFGYTSYFYMAAALLLGAGWLWIGIAGLRRLPENRDTTWDDRWARQVFGFSILVLTVLSLAIGIDSFL